MKVQRLRNYLIQNRAYSSVTQIACHIYGKIKWGWLINAYIYKFEEQKIGFIESWGWYREQQGSAKHCDDCTVEGDFKKGDAWYFEMIYIKIHLLFVSQYIGKISQVLAWNHRKGYTSSECPNSKYKNSIVEAGVYHLKQLRGSKSMRNSQKCRDL